MLNELHGRLQTRRLHYWRDKRGHEVDIVVPVSGQPPVAVECKWRAASFEPANLLAFRRRYPGGRNLVVAGDVDRPWVERYGSEVVEFVGLEDLARALQTMLRGGEAGAGSR